jgi:hypothetical protein
MICQVCSKRLYGGNTYCENCIKEKCKVYNCFEKRQRCKKERCKSRFICCEYHNKKKYCKYCICSEEKCKKERCKKIETCGEHIIFLKKIPMELVYMIISYI